MEQRNKARGRIPSILKKPNNRKGDLLDKSSKIKRENLEADVKLLPQGCTPLMYACQQADYTAVVDALNKDPSTVRVRDRSLRSALHYCASSSASNGAASEAARAACADRVLMAAPALVGTRDADGLTPLHLAVVHGNVPLVQTLLAAGADVNATDDEQHTVVHWATVCGEVGALRAVLAAGADAATADQHGGYPLHYAAQMCGAPATTDHQSRGAALEVLRSLLREAGASVEVRDGEGRTPLQWAASAGSAPAVLALTKAGARVDDADRDGLTALHCAAARGHTEALETLIGLCGARVDVADSHGCTPLHYAAALGHADATVALLDQGADAHRQDKRGRSPAHTAAAKGQIETVRILGARGANLWLRNSKGDLPLHEAVASGRRELVKWLLDGRPSQVNATNHEGRTPLHIAAATDNADLCRLLLDRGAEVNPVARSSKNEHLTPLDCATIKGHRTTAKYLQMHGGLPASKLSNTQIVIDGAPITSLPTRKVTSTRIDVRDRIRIEKREVVEISSPIHERRRVRRRDKSESTSSSEDNRKSRRRSEKYSDSHRHHDRRKRLIEPQKSFSDGYDTDMDRENKKETFKKRHKKESKNGRSRSEPSRRSKSGARQYCRYQFKSDSSSETESYSESKTNRRHRKRTTKRSGSTSEGSSSETSERRSTKRKGKKTSIHIENDGEKQSLNIVRCRNLGDNQTPDMNENEQTKETLASGKSDTENNENKLLKTKTQSETETETLSVRTNMIVTEAQIHMARDSNQQGSSEITVTVDDANNVSIETANMSVTHKDLNDEQKSDTERYQNDKSSKEFNADTDENKQHHDNKPDSNTAERSSAKNTENSGNVQNKEVDGQPSSDFKGNNENAKISSNDPKEEGTNDQQNSGNPSTAAMHRRKSFQVLSGPAETGIDDEHPENTEGESRDKINLAAVSFASKDEIFQSKDSDRHSDNLMGEEIVHSESGIDRSDQTSVQKDTSNTLSSEDKRKEYASTTAGSSTEAAMSKGFVAAMPDRAVQQVIMENAADNYNINLSQDLPKQVRKSSKDSSSRKSSIYETESYKVLSDIASAPDMGGSGILKRTTSIDNAFHDDQATLRVNNLMKISPRIPSVSDNEIYHSEVNSRRKRFRKKGRTKSRTTIRSKSENSERGYESSGLRDSGFEPSPRVVERRIMSPRIAAYYQQRNASGRHSGKSDSRIPVRKPGDKRAVDMKSVTQRIQTNMRRYYCERKIFQHLLELKRLQIRTSKTNEAVLVKRAIDDYNQSSLSNVGLGPYNNPDYSFSSFEKFLYESLRKLQKSGKKHLDNLPLKPIDFDYGESELYKMTAIPDNPCLCTNKTHRCYHAVHAYTGIPCSAYIPFKWDHHTMPKPATAGPSTKSKSFLPKINARPGKPHVTLEVSHGNEKQLIALPAEKLEKNKRYYVTFTVKGSEPPSDNDNASPSNTKSIKSG